MDARAAHEQRGRNTPVLIKIAPDLTLGELDDVVGGARKQRVDGMIIGNTTVARPPACAIRRPRARPGGSPDVRCSHSSTRMLAETYVRVEGAFPLVGVGGIDSGATALAKIRAGACLIQLYSALVFHGLRLIAGIKSDLSNELRRGGHAGLDEIVGADAAAMTAEEWPA